MKTNSSLTDLVDFKHVRRGMFDDGSYCKHCNCSSEGWCIDKKAWCHSVKKKCEINLAYISESNMSFKRRKS